MPLYCFLCDSCGESFEILATISQKEAGLTPKCPSCQSEKTHQVLTAGLVLRGTSMGGVAPSGCGPGSGPSCCG